VVAAIPAGGVPVGVVLARTLKLPLDILVVSKITLPWTTEAGYGAVAADGSVILG
jgi:predicted phosphoribosyltransferase